MELIAIDLDVTVGDLIGALQMGAHFCRATTDGRELAEEMERVAYVLATFAQPAAGHAEAIPQALSRCQ